ncbi:2,5-diketo-D-gluconic acid reductase [Erysipelothrix larvae]|uniref:2,5-diketo-D-gluconic acid reductase n=1 Tax=Erysipelothrix larvae TaxID=1514105 RepID=A0A0X8H076_9FIRM|nr:aldo/keto reductase [Erysipelothrix larvae]AMC93604.1 2,5-diketo-D-gluconic acid reductase [Erysipelothrix larvae]
MTFILNDGTVLPDIGFGTYGLKGEMGVHAIVSALQNGYRLLDSAFNYENEGTVGEAIRQSKIKREEILVTSKLPGRYHAYDAALLTIQESLSRSGLDAFDIYLIHWPNPREDKYVEAWRALVEAKRRGLVKSIGVSNFLPEHIDRLIKETGVTPSLNQIECHPSFNQIISREYNTSKGIVTQAWSPLGRDTGILEHPLFKELQIKYHKTPAQIVLRWELHLHVLPIPKSATDIRQKENLDIFDFELESCDIQRINNLSNVFGRLKGQDPAIYQEF